VYTVVLTVVDITIGVIILKSNLQEAPTAVPNTLPFVASPKKETNGSKLGVELVTESFQLIIKLTEMVLKLPRTLSVCIVLATLGAVFPIVAVLGVVGVIEVVVVIGPTCPPVDAPLVCNQEGVSSNAIGLEPVRLYIFRVAIYNIHLYYKINN
jgi:hypothetical protein